MKRVSTAGIRLSLTVLLLLLATVPQNVTAQPNVSQDIPVEEIRSNPKKPQPTPKDVNILQKTTAGKPDGTPKGMAKAKVEPQPVEVRLVCAPCSADCSKFDIQLWNGEDADYEKLYGAYLLAEAVLGDGNLVKDHLASPLEIQQIVRALLLAAFKSYQHSLDDLREKAKNDPNLCAEAKAIIDSSLASHKKGELKPLGKDRNEAQIKAALGNISLNNVAVPDLGVDGIKITQYKQLLDHLFEMRYLEGEDQKAAYGQFTGSIRSGYLTADEVKAFVAAAVDQFPPQLKAEIEQSTADALQALQDRYNELNSSIEASCGNYETGRYATPIGAEPPLIAEGSKPFRFADLMLNIDQTNKELLMFASDVEKQRYAVDDTYKTHLLQVKSQLAYGQKDNGNGSIAGWLSLTKPLGHGDQIGITVHGERHQADGLLGPILSTNNAGIRATYSIGLSPHNSRKLDRIQRSIDSNLLMQSWADYYKTEKTSQTALLDLYKKVVAARGRIYFHQVAAHLSLERIALSAEATPDALEVGTLMQSLTSAETPGKTFDVDKELQALNKANLERASSAVASAMTEAHKQQVEIEAANVEYHNAVDDMLATYGCRIYIDSSIPIGCEIVPDNAAEQFRIGPDLALGLNDELTNIALLNDFEYHDKVWSAAANRVRGEQSFKQSGAELKAFLHADSEHAGSVDDLGNVKAGEELKILSGLAYSKNVDDSERTRLSTAMGFYLEADKNQAEAEQRCTDVLVAVRQAKRNYLSTLAQFQTQRDVYRTSIAAYQEALAEWSPDDPASDLKVSDTYDTFLDAGEKLADALAEFVEAQYKLELLVGDFVSSECEGYDELISQETGTRARQ